MFFEQFFFQNLISPPFANSFFFLYLFYCVLVLYFVSVSIFKPGFILEKPEMHTYFNVFLYCFKKTMGLKKIFNIESYVGKKRISDMENFHPAFLFNKYLHTHIKSMILGQVNY